MNQTMYVVFLDVDGVLNTMTTCKSAPSELYKGIDDARIKILAKTMDECGASGVVLTSTWKDLDSEHEDYIYLRDGLLKYGIKILGKTEDVNVTQRGDGILDYLARFPEIEEFVILDDRHYNFQDSTKLWENYIDTCGKGIEHSVAASKTPTVTAMVFLDAVEKYSRA